MRIGIEAQRLFRKKKHGMEVVTLELIRHLQQIDRNNEYVVFVKEDEDAACIQSTFNFEIVRTPAHSYPYWEQIYLPRIARKTGIDLLHCTSNTAPIWYRNPLMLTLHDIIYLEKIDFSGTHYQNFGNLYRRLVIPKVVTHCEQIITVSEFEKKRITSQLKLSDEKVKVVYNAISQNFRVISDASALEKVAHKYSLPEKFILFFGNTAPKKNTPGVVEAYLQYCHNTQDPLPLVVTDCTKEFIEQIKARVDPERKMAADIVVLDHIPFETLPLVYNLASLFLYPSLRESFGMPIIEAMACGVPVITSNTSSMPEVAGQAALLINPANPKEIAEAMYQVLNEPSLREQMRANGLRRAALFSWENTARQVLEYYQNCFVQKTAV